jgi:hypothetical protein
LVTTGLLAGQTLATGVFDVVRTSGVAAMTAHLGYPAYFPVMLGVAKVLAAMALVLPVPRTLREWAYAGLTFDFIAAGVSHAVTGDRGVLLALPVIALSILTVSYATWRRGLHDDARVAARRAS